MRQKEGVSFREPGLAWPTNKPVCILLLQTKTKNGQRVLVWTTDKQNLDVLGYFSWPPRVHLLVVAWLLFVCYFLKFLLRFFLQFNIIFFPLKRFHLLVFPHKIARINKILD